MFNLLKRIFSPAMEKRSAVSGFTAEIMRVSEAYISGRTRHRGIDRDGVSRACRFGKTG